jgi:hypothetical protein
MDLSEGRNKERDTTPVLFMGVKINKVWNEKFKELSDQLNLSHQQTINWILDNWWDLIGQGLVIESMNPEIPREEGHEGNTRSVEDLPVTYHSNEVN